MSSSPRVVHVNRKQLTPFQAVEWEAIISKCSAVVCKKGAQEEEGANQYWYDHQSGLWGWVGGPISGMVEPKLTFIQGTVEGNWSVKQNVKEYEPMGVWVNGREVHPLDLDHFARLRLPIKKLEKKGAPAEFWTIDENGNVMKELDESISSGITETVPTNLFISVYSPEWIDQTTIEQMSGSNTPQRKRDKLKKFIGVNKSGDFIYKVEIQFSTTTVTTHCKHHQFVEFHEKVKKKYSSLELPPLPKELKKNPPEVLMEQTRARIESYLQKAVEHKVVRNFDEALVVLDIHQSLNPSVTGKLHKDAFEKPLLILTEAEKISVAKLYVFSANTWPANLLPILNQLLSGLKISYTDHLSILDTLGKAECPRRIGELETQYKWAIIWEVLNESFKAGAVDANVHVSLQTIAYELGVSLKELIDVEHKTAEFLHTKLTEMEEEKKKTTSGSRKAKILFGGVVGGGLLLVTGIIATPLLLPVFLGSAVALAAVVPAGVSTAILMGAGLAALVGGPGLPLVFGAAGAGLGSLKAHKLTQGVSEYGFQSIPLKISPEDEEEEENDKKLIREPYYINHKTNEVVEIQPVTIPEVKVDPKKNPNAYLIEKVCYNEKGELVGNPLAVEAAIKDGIIAESEVPEMYRVENNPKIVEVQTITVSAPKPNTSSDPINEMDEIVDSTPVEEQDVDNVGLRVCICAQGWLWKKADLTRFWMPVRKADPSLEVYCLRWETDALKDLGICVVKTGTTMLASKAVKFWLTLMIATVAAVLEILALPLMIILLAGMIDNSWSIVNSLAKKVGKLLASTLMDRVQGNRPVTLIATSLGCQVMFYCLEEMINIEKNSNGARKASGIVENVFLLGGACTSKPERWEKVKSIVAGRLVNGHCKTDWILGLVHRTAGQTKRAAGLKAIESKLVENIDLGEIVTGHLSYRSKLPEILEVLQISRSINVLDWKYDPMDEEKQTA